MQQLLVMSRSAVLVNGILGPWITYKGGLRQGDALSPYLFLLVADVLQTMVKADARIKHPMTDGTTPVLLYVDDTIILVHADICSVQRLKQALDNFSMCTGLKINFGKSTFMPMHVPPMELQTFMELLQCKQGMFP